MHPRLLVILIWSWLSGPLGVIHLSCPSRSVHLQYADSVIILCFLHLLQPQEMIQDGWFPFSFTWSNKTGICYSFLINYHSQIQKCDGPGSQIFANHIVASKLASLLQWLGKETMRCQGMKNDESMAWASLLSWLGSSINLPYKAGIHLELCPWGLRCCGSANWTKYFSKFMRVNALFWSCLSSERSLDRPPVPMLQTEGQVRITSLQFICISMVCRRIRFPLSNIHICISITVKFWYRCHAPPLPHMKDWYRLLGFLPSW